VTKLVHEFKFAMKNEIMDAVFISHITNKCARHLSHLSERMSSRVGEFNFEQHLALVSSEYSFTS